MNTTKIKITGYNGDMPLNILFSKLCLLRTVKAIGDIETVNNTQLSRLKQFNVQFEKLNK